MSTTRINFEVPDEWIKEVRKYLPHGVRSEVYRCMYRMLMRDLRNQGMAKTVDLLITDRATITCVQNSDKVRKKETVDAA